MNAETRPWEAAWPHDVSSGGTARRVTSRSVQLQKSSAAPTDHSLGTSRVSNFQVIFVTRLLRHLMYFSYSVLIFIGGRGL